MKCEGLTPEQLVLVSCPPSGLSLAGLVRHLTGLEHWFHEFDGKPGHSLDDAVEMQHEPTRIRPRLVRSLGLTCDTFSRPARPQVADLRFIVRME